MTIGLPGWLTWLGDKMGEKFPDGDEDALRRLAQQFREVADGLESESLSSTRTAISTALDNIEGRTREAMETEYSSLTSGDASIQTLVSQVRSLADGLENMGTEVQFTKEMYIEPPQFEWTPEIAGRRVLLEGCLHVQDASVVYA
ncbi:hypothetical protein [Gordonia polyisoprenivorans]|uniref:WXG100-like domain-containing protein n=1 Tax=Gordonia polyisoprenivorans TaxID=84595 RepID=UPI0023000A09|nr:hypothetical protein [Gordonia polyisoprenivorans]WCB36168.1 hypothetical protein PHA63_19095 [Gordonia polyisoprenivorans]